MIPRNSLSGLRCAEGRLQAFSREDFLGHVFLELNRFLGMATGAKPPSVSGKRKEVRVPGIVVGVVHPGEALVQVTASQA